MEWYSEPISHLTEIVKINAKCEQHAMLRGYTPGASFDIGGDLEINIRLVIEPYALEHFHMCVDKFAGDGEASDIFAGIINETSLAYAGRMTILARSHIRSLYDTAVSQYFFSNNRPSGFNNSGSVLRQVCHTGTWPAKSGFWFDERLIGYLETLKKTRPTVSLSLDACIPHLLDFDRRCSEEAAKLREKEEAARR